MTREARLVIPDAPHHITQRGVRRCAVFLDDSDRKTYLDLFLQNSRRFLLRILAYCLMPNHVHFVAVPGNPDSIWKTFHRCHSIYATEFNSKHGFSGHLFQGRPNSSVLDDAHQWAAMRYVELNPVRAGMVSKAEDYRWSSARAHCGIQDDPLVNRNWLPSGAFEGWQQWLIETNSKEADHEIREKTFTGQPCGDAAFVKLIRSKFAK